MWRDATPGCGAQHPHRSNRRQRSAAAPGAGGVLRVSMPRGRGAVTRERRACGLVDAPASAVSTPWGILKRAPPLSRPCCWASSSPRDRRPGRASRNDPASEALEVNARARRKPTQLGNRGGVEDVMRACAPASGRGEGSHSGRAVRRRSPRQVSGHWAEAREPDWISHRAERSALYLLQRPCIFYRSGLRRLNASGLWVRSGTGAVRDLEPDEKHQRWRSE